MSYKSRVYRQRNAHQHDNEQSKEPDKFFTRAAEKSDAKAGKTPFFQAKSNEPAATDDKKEKQADQAAKAVTDQPPANDKKEETIQKLSTPEEDKKPATNDERMKNDKDKQQ